MMITELEEVDMEAAVEEAEADLEVTTITTEVEAVDLEVEVEAMEEAVMEEEADMEEVGIGNSSISHHILLSRVSINIDNLRTLSAYW